MIENKWGCQDFQSNSDAPIKIQIWILEWIPHAPLAPHAPQPPPAHVRVGGQCLCSVQALCEGFSPMREWCCLHDWHACQGADSSWCVPSWSGVPASLVTCQYGPHIHPWCVPNLKQPSIYLTYNGHGSQWIEWGRVHHASQSGLEFTSRCSFPPAVTHTYM